MCDTFLLRGGAVSRAARTAGLGDRFRYWTGASGRSYLFTAVAVDELAEFRDAVVLFATIGADGEGLARFVTEIDEAGNWAEAAQAETAMRDGTAQIFVHLLARGAAGRASVLADLHGAVLARAA